MELTSGIAIGPYRLLEPAGEGGMAQVWRAFDARLERHVAIKFIAPRFAADSAYVDRFRREARAISRLDHPNILTVHDFGEQDGWTYMVSPFLSGGTLAARMRGGPKTVSEAVKLLEPLASALDYAHRRGVVHRDVKPQNVLFNDEGRLILTDFGIVRMLEGTSHQSVAGSQTGTPTYMSPEQANGQPAGPASDQYSLGLMAYEMLTGRRPFLAETPMAMMRAHADLLVPPPRALNPAISDGVQAVLFKVLAKAPGNRYPICETFVTALRAATPPTRPAHLPAAALPKPAPLPRSHPRDLDGKRPLAQSVHTPVRPSEPQPDERLNPGSRQGAGYPGEGAAGQARAEHRHAIEIIGALLVVAVITFGILSLARPPFDWRPAPTSSPASGAPTATLPAEAKSGPFIPALLPPTPTAAAPTLVAPPASLATPVTAPAPSPSAPPASTALTIRPRPDAEGVNLRSAPNDGNNVIDSFLINDPRLAALRVDAPVRGGLLTVRDPSFRIPLWFRVVWPPDSNSRAFVHCSVVEIITGAGDARPGCDPSLLPNV